nr:carbohydrate sulfotransferase 14-like [Lepeophtheirus salmonis]XP_040572017.1 carbohydrate sulfotransferase 14-like [Lepeophtheirus salmonis]
MRLIKDSNKKNALLLFILSVGLLIAIKMALQYKIKNVTDLEEKIQKERLERIDRKRIMSHLMVDHKHGLTYCWNHKAASTSWSEFFSRLTNNIYILRSKEYYKLNSYMAPRTELELTESLRETTKFMVIRHPLSRIVSAYRDRIKNNPDSFQGRKFIPLIHNQVKNQVTIDRIPSFNDFVQYIVNGNSISIDSHWTPYSLQCDPCSIKYDAIIKTETMMKDFTYIQTKKNLTKEISLFERHRINRSEKEEFTATKKYLSQLENQLFYKLLAHYQQDFLLFDYDPFLFIG